FKRLGNMRTVPRLPLQNPLRSPFPGRDSQGNPTTTRQVIPKLTRRPHRETTGPEKSMYISVLEARRKLISAWRQVATTERRTAWSLLRRGFLYWREPALIREGQKPDYLTFGRGRMWVEV